MARIKITIEGDVRSGKSTLAKWIESQLGIVSKKIEVTDDDDSANARNIYNAIANTTIEVVVKK